jgi:mycofactocin precursor
MTAVDEQLEAIEPTEVEAEGGDEEDVLVEEISIDGMCGVY